MSAQLTPSKDPRMSNKIGTQKAIWEDKIGTKEEEEIFSQTLHLSTIKTLLLIF